MISVMSIELALFSFNRMASAVSSMPYDQVPQAQRTPERTVVLPVTEPLDSVPQLSLPVGKAEVKLPPISSDNIVTRKQLASDNP